MTRLAARSQWLRRLLLGAAAGLLAVPAAAGDPDCVAGAPPDVQLQIEGAIGLPVLQNGLIAPEDTALACHDRFCAEFNNLTRTPIWVVEHLNPDIVERNF
ncbi:MAG: hypothetical protein PVG98_15140, partial [Chromatiales bacterium]